VSLRIFEEPHETAEPIEQTQVSILSRIGFGFWALMVALIPAAVANVSSIRIINLFRSMTNAETAGSAYVLGSLNVINTPMVIALGVASFLAFGMAIALAVYPKLRLAAVGLPFSIAIPILAALPGVFLWNAESNIADLLGGKLRNVSVPEFAQTTNNLVLLGLVSSIVVIALILVCGIVSVCLPRRFRGDPASAPRAFVWAVSGILLLVFGGLFFVVV
jgi:hypothetical protein